MAGKKKTGSARGARKRRGKSEADTGAKEGAVEVRTAGLGDNSQLPIPAPDDWNHHKKSILGWREKVTTAQGHLRNAIKTAKKAGVDMDAMNLVIGIERDNDPGKTLNYFRQIDLGLETGDSSLRLSVHDTLAGDEAELVAKRGYEDGKAGRTPNNQYPENSDLANIYQQNWMKGQAENLGVGLPDGESEVEPIAAE